MSTTLISLVIFLVATSVLVWILADLSLCQPLKILPREQSREKPQAVVHFPNVDKRKADPPCILHEHKLKER
jgi:hypothetical protein